LLSCGAAVIRFIFHLLFLFFLDTVQYRTAYRVPGYCCGMIATVPGYRSGLSVLQQLTYITVPGYCERTLYTRRTLQSSCSKLYFTRYARAKPAYALPNTGGRGDCRLLWSARRTRVRYFCCCIFQFSVFRTWCQTNSSCSCSSIAATSGLHQTLSTFPLESARSSSYRLWTASCAAKVAACQTPSTAWR
jgi:hypothetical protein